MARNQNSIWAEWKNKNLGRTHAQSRASSLLANQRTVYDYDSGGIIGQKSDWLGTI